jgi:phage shock protein E
VTIALRDRSPASRTTRATRRAAGLAAALALVLAGCEAATADDVPEQDPAASPAATEVVDLSPAETAVFLEQSPDAVVIDVRTPEEVAQGALAEATFIDLQGPDFRGRIAELDRDATYVLYCRTGNRSGQAAEIMRELGFEALYNAGGFDELAAIGLTTQP